MEVLQFFLLVHNKLNKALRFIHHPTLHYSHLSKHLKLEQNQKYQPGSKEIPKPANATMF